MSGWGSDSNEKKNGDNKGTGWRSDSNEKKNWGNNNKGTVMEEINSTVVSYRLVR